MIKVLFSFSITLFGFVTGIEAQKINELIDAEKSFAAWSVAHGTRSAFLQFLDSSALVFEKGQPVNGLSSWKAKGNSTGILDWQPTVAELAKSGDFGYTSGPWTFKKSIDDTVVARGRFTSIWQKKKGEWKVILDLGVTGTPPSVFDSAIWKREKDGKYKKASASSLLKAEKDFIAYVYKNPTQAFVDNMSSEILFYRRDEMQLGEWNSLPDKVEYTPMGSGIASSGDLGYVYGTATTGNHSDNYLRIWRREGKKWKLVAQVLRV